MDEIVNILYRILSIVTYIIGALLLTYPLEGGKRATYFASVVTAPLSFAGSVTLWDYVGMSLPFIMKLAISMGLALGASLLIIKYLPVRKKA
ncbi:hypothetical protein HF313_30365 [Massilia atriviolacea]|uniref:Uncharacterized protein n=1 Tax=Massilia atriviolacea TaxID=2495579 RepID=A0A430HH56_9BURK|nr:hypothetical protein [Massilia atriviolacea]RSZ56837.1 hypothetical protein EJB06_23155 [Massilia atriviolacea]